MVQMKMECLVFVYLYSFISVSIDLPNMRECK